MLQLWAVCWMDKGGKVEITSGFVPHPPPHYHHHNHHHHDTSIHLLVHSGGTIWTDPKRDRVVCSWASAMEMTEKNEEVLDHWTRLNWLFLRRSQTSKQCWTLNWYNTKLKKRRKRDKGAFQRPGMCLLLNLKCDRYQGTGETKNDRITPISIILRKNYNLCVVTPSWVVYRTGCQTLITDCTEC